MNVKICKLERKQGSASVLGIITITYKWMWFKWRRDAFLGAHGYWKFSDTTRDVDYGFRNVNVLLNIFCESGLDEYEIN